MMNAIFLVIAALFFLWVVGAAIYSEWLKRTPQRPCTDALRRARHLREEVLSRRENRDIERLGYFFLASPTKRGTVYRIPIGINDRVRLYVSDGLPQRDLCVGFIGLPADDVVAARKLWILGNENAFHDAANSFQCEPDAGDREYLRWRHRTILRSWMLGATTVTRRLLTSIRARF